jgi:high-affinity nickel-transport protein
VSQPSSGLHATTDIIGTSISGAFLYLIAVINLGVLISIFRLYRQTGSGQCDAAELERQLDNRGLINRVLGGYAQRIDSSWKMYPVGMLFGLGFDTATEIALLVLAGTAVVGGVPIWAILSLPILFAAGMCLFDTLDGCFMNFAYDWAFANPVRKIFYNLTITGLSVAVAFAIGTIEILGLVAKEANLDSPFWIFVARFNINMAGFVIVALFVVTWLGAWAYWRLAGVANRGSPSAGDEALTPPSGGRDQSDWIAEIPTIGAFSGSPPAEPKNPASPKLKIPPSRPTIQ